MSHSGGVCVCVGGGGSIKNAYYILAGQGPFQKCGASYRRSACSKFCAHVQEYQTLHRNPRDPRAPIKMPLT